MARLREGIELLSLPVETSEGKEGERKGDGAVTLKEADDLVYASSGQAAEVLTRLGCSHLVPGDARAILGRRVESAG